MGLGQVEDLLHRLAEAHPEEAARADRGHRLDRLEAAVAGVRARVEERREPLAPVGLAIATISASDASDARDHGQVADRRARGHQQRPDREADDHGGAHVRLLHEQRAGDAHHDQQRLDQPPSVRALRGRAASSCAA